MRELALFAGAGGGILGGILLGWRTVCAVEIDAYCRSVLLARQRDGILGRFAIWDDVRTFDGARWRGHVDIITGGFPCQDISSVGRRAGIDGEKSGLWREFARIIREVGPALVLVENSPMLTTRGLGVVLGDLAALGYDARWDVLGAHHIGAPHLRDRMWVVAADPDRRRERAQSEHAEVACAPSPGAHAADADGAALREQRLSVGPQGGSQGQASRKPRDIDWWRTHRFEGMDAGVADRMERVRATGNGQVPGVVRLAWEALAPEEFYAP